MWQGSREGVGVGTAELQVVHGVGNKGNGRLLGSMLTRGMCKAGMQPNNQNQSHMCKWGQQAKEEGKEEEQVQEWSTRGKGVYMAWQGTGIQGKV